MSDNEKKNSQKPLGNTSPPEDRLSVTQHELALGGKKLRYTATAGTIVLKEEAEKRGEQQGESEGEKPKASVFFVAYTLNDVADKTKRPLTFSFNGGPGSSSVWLHLGLLGPKRVVLNDDGTMPPPPFRLEPNAHSLLDAADLVFIDPVSTGFSRVVPGEKAKEFHGFKKDIESVGEFIRLYASRHRRWTSPKFLIGESYGTTRAAGLTGYLQERCGMALNGVMLVSSILDFQTARFAPGNDLPHVLFLPTYAATAWYHKRLPPALQEKPLAEFLPEVEAFAAGPYAAALAKGSALSATESARLAKRLARYTGLSKDYVERTNLRVNIYRFVKELLRDQRRTVGRLDSRMTGMDRDAAGEHHEQDPSLTAITGPYTATFNDYVRDELNFESDLPYEILTSRVHPWRFDDHENTYVNVAETLRKTVCANPYLKVFVANGFYDLATPYFATVHTFNHLALEPELQGNVSLGFYEAGHMMYVHLPSLERLKADLREFLASACPKF